MMVMIINHIENLETARAMLMYSAAKDREASLVEMIGKDPKEELFFNLFSPGQCCVLQTKPVGEKGQEKENRKELRNLFSSGTS